MSNFKDLTGQRFALLTVKSRAANSTSGKAYWNCVCDCGNQTVVSGTNLRSGAVKSCGCLVRKRKDTHHLSKTWEKEFLSFYKWAMSNGYGEDLTIDRIDNNSDYSPENCRWVSRKVQANNRSFCKMIEYNGKVQTLMQWCEELNLNYKRVHSRLYRLGWTFKKAISTPVKRKE